MIIRLSLEDPTLSVGEEFAIARALHAKRAKNISGQRARYRAKQRARGLCERCNNPVKSGRVSCEAHLRGDAERAREWTLARRVPNRARGRKR